MTSENDVLTNARAQMLYDANRKSAGVAYLLCIFLGGFGAHRFYLGRTPSAIGQLVLWVLGWLTFLLTWIPLGIWLFIDLFLIPGMIREENMKVADRFSNQ